MNTVNGKCGSRRCCLLLTYYNYLLSFHSDHLTFTGESIHVTVALCAIADKGARDVGADRIVRRTRVVTRETFVVICTIKKKYDNLKSEYTPHLIML